MPIRIEVGPRDLKNNQFMTVRRDTGAKNTYKWESAVDDIKELSETIQKSMFDKYVYFNDPSKKFPVC